VLQLDEAWRKAVAKINDMKKAIGKIQRESIAPKKKAKENCDAEVAEVSRMKAEAAELEKSLPGMEAARDRALGKLGNVVDPEVPVSDDEDKDNAVKNLFPMPPHVTLPSPVSTLEYRRPPSKPLKHDDLLWRIDGYDDERGRKVAGHRGYFLKNAGVRLNQALINYAVDFLQKKDFSDKKKYDVLQPPFFMKKELMGGIAQLEDYDEQLYCVTGKTDDPAGASEKYLIATSEQPICGYHMGEWLEEKDLPKRYAGVSTCFRKEAGSSGRDIRGIFRVHQFEKVEQFVICKDDIEESKKMQDEILANAEEFYQSLEFPYRVVTIVSAELNDAAIKKYDLEAWFPGQEAYRELVSCSNCTDYQSRSMGIRCGTKKMGQTSASFVHMLNATLCATGRGICCLLENHQTETGVKIPEPLQRYMGTDFLPFVQGPREMSKSEKAQIAGEANKQATTSGGCDAAVKSAAPAPARASTPAPANAPVAVKIVAKITAIGNSIRELKAAKAAKDEIMAKVEELKAAKEEYLAETGEAYIAPGQQGSSKDKKKKEKAAKGGGAGVGVPVPRKEKKEKQAAAKLAPAAGNLTPSTKPASAEVGGGAFGMFTVEVAKVDKALLAQSYVCGYVPTAEDATTFSAFSDKSINETVAKAKGFKNAARWLGHMATFTAAERAAWSADGSKPRPVTVYASAPIVGKLSLLPQERATARPTVPTLAPKTPNHGTPTEGDDDFDVFGSGEIVVPTTSRAEKAALLKKQKDAETEAAKQKALERLAKKEANQRTLCNLEITPWEAEQDLVALHNKIKETVVRDGLKWSEGCKLVEVGYGIKKMVLTAVLKMNLSMDAIIEEMADEDEGTFRDEIQSFTMTSMSLL
jgi:seryl-tRNA synthetase